MAAVLHAHVDHDISMELLEQMSLDVSPSGTKRWKLPPAKWLITVDDGRPAAYNE